MSNHQKTRLYFIPLVLSLILFFFLSLAIGSVTIPMSEVLKTMFRETTYSQWSIIIFEFRLPKSIAAILAGAALSMSGLMMQTLFQNPLSGPNILGITAGSSLGVALVVFGGTFLFKADLASFNALNDFSLISSSILGSLVTLGIILIINSKVKSRSTILIIGIMINFFASSIISILLYYSQPEDLQTYISWTLGSFRSISWDDLNILFPPIALTLVCSIFVIKPLNALLLGERYASSMGVSVKYVRYCIILITALQTGAITAFCGPIGFIGIAVPHLCRNLFKTSDHKILIPAVLLLGALLTLVSEFIAQLPGSPHTLPVNAVTSLFGAPVIVWILLRKKKIMTHD